MEPEKVRIRLPEELWWDNCVTRDRRMLIHCIYEQSGMRGVIKLNDKSITCNMCEKEMVKDGIREALQFLKKND